MPVLTCDVEKIYKKDSNLKKEDINQLKEWLKKQPHLPKATEEQLIWFLHSCHYSIERAKTTIDVFFTIRTVGPELSTVPDLADLNSMLSAWFLGILPEKTKEGYNYLFFKLIDTNPDRFSVSDASTVFLLQKLLHLHQYGPMEGLVILADVQGTGLGHVTRCPMTVLRRLFCYLQEASPVRIKQIHLFNINVYFDKIFNLIKPFIKKELLDLIKLYTSVDDLWKNIPKDVLDFLDYGGKQSFSTLKEKTIENISENREILKFWELQKVDERQRLEKTTFGNAGFGIDGAFKKLEVD